MNDSRIDAATDVQSRQHWLMPTRRRVVAGLVVALALWGWFDVRNRAYSDPAQHGLHKTDFTVYTEAGAAFFDGRDPYTVTNLRGWGYLYPPLFALFVSPLSGLDTQNQAIIWFALCVLMAWGCGYEVVRIARSVLPEAPLRGLFGPIPPWIGNAALVASVLPALNCLQRGQVGVAKLYVLLFGFRLLVESRSVIAGLLAGVVLAFPIVLKITPVVPVGVALVQQLAAACSARTKNAWRRPSAVWLGNAVGLLVWLFVFPAALVGWSANLDHLHTWWSDVAVYAESTLENDVAGDSTSVRNQSLSNAAHRLGNFLHYALAGGPHDLGPEQLRKGGGGLLMDAPEVDLALAVVRAAAGVLALAVGIRMGWTQDRLGQAAAFGLACAATLILFSIARGHYYVMLFPAVAFVGWWQWQQGLGRFAVAMAVAPGVLVTLHYVSVNVFGRVGLLGLGITCWYFAAVAVMLWPRRRAAQQVDCLPDRVLARPRAAQQPVAA